MPPRTLYDHQGRPVELGPPLASGGEGAVFTLPAERNQIAKIYHQQPDAVRVEKLRWMVQHGDAALRRFAAWPTATLHDTPGGPLAGFLMPRFDGFKAVHMLYSPAHRRSAFPAADWAFLAHAAANVAAAFDAVHEHGHVVGDVNQSNVLVSERTLTALIDCDSFQVKADGRVYRCEVGVGPYTPPELQGVNFRDVDRRVNHDRFGLAVLLFHLLFMGRHPFAGRYLGAGEMPLERAIAEYRFVYSEADPATRMGPPPYSLALRTASMELAQLFERAFGSGSERDGARPAAAEWHAALTAFEAGLRPCPREPGHKVPAHLVDCPWCGIVRNGGPNFFLGAGLVGTTFQVDPAALDALWKRVEAVPLRRYSPPAAPAAALSRLRPRRPPPGGRLARLTEAVESLGCAGLVCFVAVFLLPSWLFGFPPLEWCWVLGLGVYYGLTWLGRRDNRGRDAEKQRLTESHKARRAEAAAAEDEWKQTAKRYREEHPRLNDALSDLKKRYERLQADYAREAPPAEGGPDPNEEAEGREQHLRSLFIHEQKIPGIGPGRAVLLASYGIETAADLNETSLQTIKGIGKVLRENLLAWKAAALAEYRFDPADARTPPPAPRELVFKYRQLEEGIRAQMQKALTDLESLSRQTEEQDRALRTRIEAALLEAAQAALDLKAQ